MVVEVVGKKQWMHVHSTLHGPPTPLPHQTSKKNSTLQGPPIPLPLQTSKQINSPPRHVAGDHGGLARLQHQACIPAHQPISQILLGAGLDQGPGKRVGGHAGAGQHGDGPNSARVPQVHAHHGCRDERRGSAVVDGAETVQPSATSNIFFFFFAMFKRTCTKRRAAIPKRRVALHDGAGCGAGICGMRSGDLAGRELRAKADPAASHHMSRDCRAGAQLAA